jgi:hypothetical protein
MRKVQISREKAMALGREMVAILDSGRYVSASGTVVKIRREIQNAVRGTVSYPPDRILPTASTHRDSPTVVEIRNETTLTSARASSPWVSNLQLSILHPRSTRGEGS